MLQKEGTYILPFDDQVAKFLKDTHNKPEILLWYFLGNVVC